MKQRLSSLVLASALAATAATAGEIDVTISGFGSDDGLARIVLMEGPEGYSGAKPVTLSAAVPIIEGSARWQADLAAGTYAIIAHHDRNADDTLNRPVFALPLEPYGYSNGAWTSLGMPAFEDVAFRVGGGAVSQSIRLRTNAILTAVQVLAAAFAGVAVLFCGLTLHRRRRTARAA